MSKLTKKIFSIASGDLFARGLGFFAIIYQARILGAEGFGHITVAFSFLWYFVWLADLGLLNIGIREMSKPEDARVYRPREIYLFKIFLGIIVLILAQLIIPFLPIESTNKTIILELAFSLIPYAFLMEWYHSGKQKFGNIAVSKLIFGGIYLILIHIFIESALDIELVPRLYAISLSASAIFLFAISIKDKPFKLPVTDWSIFKKLSISALTLGVGTFFTSILQLLPPLAIGFLHSMTDAGLYGASIRIVLIMMLLDKIFVNLLLPNLSAQWIANKELTVKNLNRVYRILVITGGVSTMIAAIAAPDIIHLVYGQDFKGSAQILSGLSIFLFFTFQNSLFSFGLIAIGKDREYLYSTITSGLLAFILIVLAAKFASLLVVVLTISLSEAIIALFAYYWFNKSVKIDTLLPSLYTFLLGGLLFFISTLVSLNSIVEAILVVSIFIPTLFLLKVVTVADVLWLKEKLRK